MFARVWVSAVAVVAIVVGLIAVTPPPEAKAISAGVAFSADELPTWQTNGVVWAIGATAGKVIAGGTFTTLTPPSDGSGSPVAANGIAILNAETGNPDSCQFSMALSGGTPTVRAVTAAADGRTVYVGGNFSNIGGVTVSRLAAIDVVSCTVTAFRAPTISSVVRALAVRGNTLYIGGDFNTVDGETRQKFAALNATTGALQAWTANADETGKSIAISPDGTKVALAGNFFNVNGQYSHDLVIVDAATGANIRTYPQGFFPNTSVTQSVYSGTDGNFYIGNEGTGGGVFDGRAAFSWATLDQIWRDTCLGATQAVLEYQGTLYSASHEHDCASMNRQQDGSRHYFGAHVAATGAQLGWYPKGSDGIGEGIGPRALIVATGSTTGSDYLWAAGEFTNINDRPQMGLTRFGPNDTRVPPGVTATATAASDGAIHVKMRTVVDLDDSKLTYAVYRNNSTTPIWSGDAESLWWVRPQVTFVDKDVVAGQTYTYRVRVSDGINVAGLSSVTTATAVAPAADYASVVRSDSPSLYWAGNTTGSWLHDDGATASSGERRAGLMMNGATHTADSPIVGEIAGSTTFDGSDDYVWHQDMAPAPSTYTVETWIKTTTNRGGKIVGFGNGRPRTDTNATQLSGSYDRHVYMQNNGRVVFGAYTGSTVTLTSPTSLNDGTWHHIVATQGPAGMALYIDGTRVGQNTNSAAQAYSGVWHIGGDNLSGWPNQPASNFFAGTIDETAVYGTTLTPTAVARHFEASGRTLGLNQAPTDKYGAKVFTSDPMLYWRLGESSGTAVADSSLFGQTPGTARPGVTRGSAGLIPGNSAITTPGNTLGTVSSNASAAPPSAFTAEIWFNTTTAGGKLFGYENTTTGDGSNYDKHLYMTNSGQLVFGSWIGSAAVVTSPNGYADGQWHQATVVLNDEGRKLYVDGQLVASSTVTGAENGAGYWRLGGGNIGGWPSAPSNTYFNGRLDEFSVNLGALSELDIAQRYALGVGDSAAPTTPTGVTAGIQGGSVQLAWAASTDNTRVTEYRIYRGETAGFTADESSLIGTSRIPSFAQDLPEIGTYHYKVIAVDGALNTSEVSTSASVTVPDLIAPTVPEELVVEQTGAAGATVTWTAATDNVGVVSYTVYRGTSADFEITGSGLDTVTTNTFTETNVGEGEFFYRVVARDAAGNLSAPSGAASVLIVPADVTAPSAPGSLNATLAGADVTLTWAAATDNVGVEKYRVYRGTTAGFAANAGSRIAEVTVREYVDAGRPAGTWFYKVLAVDGAGNVGDAATASVSIVPPNEPVTVVVPITDDTMVAQAAPSTLYGTTNQLSSRGTGGTIESLLSVPLPEAPAGTVLSGVQLSVRTSNDATAGSADSHVFRLVSGSWSEATTNWNNRPTTLVSDVIGTLSGATAISTPQTVVLNAPTLSPLLGQTVTLRMSSSGADNVRIWSAEGSTSAYRPSVTFTFVPVSGPDTEAPTAPAGVAAAASGSTLNVTWSASTDNVGVTGYSVYRGTTAGFTVNAGSKIADVTTRSYADEDLAPGTYFYKVTAKDAENNVSAASAAGSGTIPVNGGEPVTVVVPITDDTMVAQAAPSTLYGTTNQLSSRGTGGTIESLLSVPLPEAPAGTVLSSVALSVRTSNDASAGSADSHVFRLVSGSWSEATTNWNNRPTNLVSDVIGTMSGATAVSTPQTVALSAPTLAPLLGDTVTLRMSSSGADNVRIWSAESSTSAYRPSITFTFVPVSGPDTEAPSVPGGIAAAVTGSAIRVTWDASTDNLGVSGYSVYRGTSAGFTANAGSKIADVTARAYNDEGLAPGTYFYKVTAKDAEDNVSAASSAASATVAAVVPDPVVQTVGVAADAMVAGNNVNGLYGSTNQLSSRGDPAIESFIDFALPAAPAGMQLTSASLAVRTSTDSTAASADTHFFHVMDEAWNEDTIRWTNRITHTASDVIGELTGASGLNAPYAVVLSPAAIASHAGQTLTLRLSSTGTDNLRLWSSEAANAAYRPVLTLTYTAAP